jgi:glycerol-3-phosphate dehydrogenase
MTSAREGAFDLLIVGGGINGAGIARDAAGRGLKVLLVERDDLAAHTSSASTKLIHGGLRYLEHFDFRLVRESLIERERLLSIAPHIVQPLEFVIPQSESIRPAWMVRLGLFIYDHLGGRQTLPRTRIIRLEDHGFGRGLEVPVGKAFVYSDCRVDDSRLVLLNALDAAERGAQIRTRTELVAAHRASDQWTATLRGPGGSSEVRARVLVNAAGPWVDALFDRLGGARKRCSIRLVKGSHIVLPRLFPGEQAFLIQNPDRRVIFAIPFEREFTLVGTTDQGWDGPPAAAVISEEEINYLLDAVHRTFARKMGTGDIRGTYSGIRPLYDNRATNASAVTRDYVLDLDTDQAPLLSIFGGKLTTYRRLAEHALDRLSRYFPALSNAWTGDVALPGGDLAQPIETYAARLGDRYPFLPPPELARLARTYGTRAERLLGGAARAADLGEKFGAMLTAREVDYLISEEWARTAEDILFRRTKLGFQVSPETVERLEDYLRSRSAGSVPAARRADDVA